MTRTLLITLALLFALPMMSKPDEYDLRRAESYRREAEYYQRKADSYRREAAYYMRKAEGYQREAAYYSRRGDADRASYYTRQAGNALDNYKTQMRYASDADSRAADYMRRAANLLR